uniref:G-protein coupled receptors family 1 profile domain-containing protein n=1 Tax=Petromyzon marinus TaxID=7757 RepID=S4RWF7_PETMA
MHKPMYLFLGNMAVADIVGCTSSLPKQLQILLTGDTEILYESCLVQMFSIHVFCNVEVLTLLNFFMKKYTSVCVTVHYGVQIMHTVKCYLAVLIGGATYGAKEVQQTMNCGRFGNKSHQQAVTSLAVGGPAPRPCVQLCAFGLFLPLFVVTIVANVAVLATVAARVDLHKPMYMFLCSLVVADLISSVSTMPKQLQMLLTGDNRILYTTCMAQIFWINVFVIMQVLTLAVISFTYFRILPECKRTHSSDFKNKALYTLFTHF